MPFEVALFLAFFILIATAIVTGGMIASRKQAAKQEALKRAASARGWLYESKREHGFRVDRWTGTTDGVSWFAESMQQTSGSKNRDRRYVQRWQGVWSPGINGAIVAMGLPRGKEDLGTTVAAGDGFFAKLAQKAVGFALDKAIDHYFGDGPGKEVDAGALYRIESQTPGFVVMAADQAEGARIVRKDWGRRSPMPRRTRVRSCRIRIGRGSCCGRRRFSSRACARSRTSTSSKDSFVQEWR